MTAGRNIDFGLSLLRRYVETLEALVDSADAPGGLGDDYRFRLAEASRLNPAAWRIVTDVLPDVSEYDHNLGYSSQARDQINDANRAIGMLELQEELEQNWPAEPVAKLDTSKLHPWVWDPARELWEIERYAEALHTAAITVNAQMQAKLGRNDGMEFTPLARNAWTTQEPEPGHPRLRIDLEETTDEDLAEVMSEDAFKDLHLGAATLGEAVFRLWRNIQSHRPTTIDEQRATEALGALSAFARMVDEAKVEVVE